MATFDSTQKAKLVKILRVNPILLADRLDYYASSISDEMKAEVVDLIAEWEAGTTARNITRIRANVKNFGAEINPDELRSLIQGDISELLFCTDLVGGGTSSNQFAISLG
jgi:hypothetical protein